MVTWRKEFTRLSDIRGQEWQKSVHGENNQHAVRNSMDDVAEILKRWEAAGRPDREEEISIQQIGPFLALMNPARAIAEIKKMLLQRHH